MLTLRVSSELKEAISKRAASKGYSTSDYLKSLVFSDLSGETEFYAQRAAVNSHITMYLIGQMIAEAKGSQELAELWPIVEEATIAAYGNRKNIPESIIAPLRENKAPLYKRLYEVFVSHNAEAKKAKK